MSQFESQKPVSHSLEIKNAQAAVGSSVEKKFTSNMNTSKLKIGQLSHMLGDFGSVQKLLEELITESTAPKLPFEVGKLPTKVTNKDGEESNLLTEIEITKEGNIQESTRQLLVELEDLYQRFKALQNKKLHPDTLGPKDITKRQKLSGKILGILAAIEQENGLSPELATMRASLTQFQDGLDSLVAGKLLDPHTSLSS